MFFIEHVFVFSLAPNEAQWRWMPPNTRHSVLNESVQTGHFDKFASFDGFWRDEELLPRVSVAPHRPLSSITPINTDLHFLCWGIPRVRPHWLNSKIGNIEFSFSKNAKSQRPGDLLRKIINFGRQFAIECCRYDISSLSSSMLLVGIRDSSAHPINLETQNYEFQNADNAENDSKLCNPPIVRRLLLLIGGMLFGFCFLLLGIFKLYKRRMILGCVSVACGLGLSVAGMSLWIVMPLTATWC